MHFVKIDDMSPDLVERIAYGYAQQLPGFSNQQIQAIIAEAQDRKKRGKIKHLYVHISTCVAAAFNANGYKWTPCEPKWMCRIKNIKAEAERRKNKPETPPATVN